MPTILDKDMIRENIYNQYKTEQGRKTFEEMFATNAFMTQQQQSALTYDYSQAMNEAYIASSQQEQAILDSNLGQGYKQLLIDENTSALQQAFDSYSSQWAQASTKVAQSSAETQQQIVNLANTQAQNIASYTNSYYDYLAKQWDLYKDDETTNQALANWFTDPLYGGRYTVKDARTDAAGNVMTDTNGNILYADPRLMTRDEIMQMAYDEDGNLTVKGIEFYDMLNANLGQGVQSFDSYLYETDKDLYEWANTANPYHYDTSVSGYTTNSYNIAKDLGIDDYTYSFAERFGGMSDEELDKMFGDFKSSIDNISTDPNAAIDDIQSSASDLITFANKMGISSELNDALSTFEIDGKKGLDALQYVIDNADNNKASDFWDVLFAQDEEILAYGSGAAVAAGVIGSSVSVPTMIGASATIPGIGPIIAAIIAVGSAAYALINAGVKSEQSKQASTKYATELQKAYNQAVTSMTSYAKTKRDASMAEYYKR